MVKPKARSPWGNHFAFLHVPIPELMNGDKFDPLEFLKKAQQIIKQKRSSLAIYLTAAVIDLICQKI